MKKIAIMTWLYNENYGSILQAYALQHFLRSEGYEAEDINYKPSLKTKLKNWTVNRNSPKLYIGKLKSLYLNKTCKKPEELKKRSKRFEEFKRKNMKLSCLYQSPQDLKVINSQYDVFVCGSDQIWSPKLMNPVFYLSFINEECKKIAYAPSFGVSHINNRKLNQIKTYLASFNNISVREKQGKDLIDKCVETEVTVQIDPTLLITDEQWDICVSKPPIKGKYILCYLLSKNDKYLRIVKYLSEKHKLHVVIITTQDGSFDTDFEEILDAGPSEWLGLIKNAELVCTDSFHGCIFSLIFSKEFVLFKRFCDNSSWSQNSRIYNLANMLNISERIIENQEELSNFKSLNYTDIKEIIKNEAEKSKKWLLEAIEEEIMSSVILKDEKNCYGCGACYQSCPEKSIIMLHNKRGFLIPSVDSEKCIDCGICIEVCPEVKDMELNTVLKAYMAISKDKNILKTSTSGGIFCEIAKYILKREGVVYGCSWDDKIQATHIKIDTIEEIVKLQKSKYVQSDIKETYKETERYLQENKLVLFSGTACQIAGLRAFLTNKMINVRNLYTIEVACHGVGSPGLFKKYIKWLENNELKIVKSFQFRNKNKHKSGEHYKFYVEYLDGSEKYYLADEDPYYGSFLKGSILRETCYICKYKKQRRIADISLSDYWGIERENKKFPAQNGVSAILLNTKNGIFLFEQVKENLYFEESTFDAITKHNKSIIASTKRPKEVLNSFDNESNELFLKDLKQKMTLGKKVKNLIPCNLKYVLKRIV